MTRFSPNVISGFALTLAGMACVISSLPAMAAEPLTKDEVRAIVREYIMENPKVILQSMDAMRAREEEERRAQQAQNLKSKQEELTKSPTSPVVGNPEGDVTVVEFFDYNCGYCHRVVPTLTKLIDEDKNVRLVLKEFPILSPQSDLAAKIAMAVWQVEKAKYWDVHNAFMKFSGPKEKESLLKLVAEAGVDRAKVEAKIDSKEIAEALEANQKLAVDLGIRGTPAFVVGTELVPGAVSFESLKKLVEDARAAQKKK